MTLRQSTEQATSRPDGRPATAAHAVDNGLRGRFDLDGFVALPGFVSGDGLVELQERLARFLHESVPRMPREAVYYEDRDNSSSLKQLQHVEHFDPWFSSLLGIGRFRELAETLLGEAVVPQNLQYFNKPPGVGQPTPAHQDGYYFQLRPCVALTMWLALDDVDEENGCVRYVRGSHRRGLRAHARTRTLGFSQGIAEYPTPEDVNGEIACPARPGDLLAHHALTIHRADGNSSPTRSRRALGLIYYGAQAREDTAAREVYERTLAAELAATERI